MSVDEEEAFASVELDDLLAGFYRDPVAVAGNGCSFPGGGRSVLFCGACATTKQQGEALSRSFVGGGGSPFPPVAVPGLFPGSSSAFLPIPFSAVRAHGVGDRSYQSMVFCLSGDLLSGGGPLYWAHCG
jgi:hypothetical protein